MNSINNKQMKSVFGSSKKFKPTAIFTADLYLKPLTTSRQDVKNYCDLFTDPLVLQKYTDGEQVSCSELKKIKNLIIKVIDWAVRWSKDDPFNGFAIYERETHQYVGNIAIASSDEQGIAELVYTLKKEFSEHNYCKQALSAITKSFIPEIIKKGALLNGHQLIGVKASS